MGSALSVCGLQASDSDHDLQPHYQSKANTRHYEQLASMCGRSVLSTTDSSVASILSNSNQLVPNAYMPQDIQVLSQRRQRHGPSRTRSRSSIGHSGTTSSMRSSRVSKFSSNVLDPTRTVRNTSVNKMYNFGSKTASSSFGYSDDDETTDPSTVEPSERMERFSVQTLRVQ